ncbi:MAG: hypothetical protein ABI140_22330 [Jatrophihabitantaceae bacterium]
MSLTRRDAGQDAMTVQVGLTGSRNGHGASHYPDGGPDLVTLTTQHAMIRLAGSPVANDQVFVRRPGQDGRLTLPVPARCEQVAKTDFGLQEPDVNIAKAGCNDGQASIKIQLINYNTIDGLQQFGLSSLDYTVLLVNSDGWTLAGAPSSGQLVSFSGPDRQTTTLSQTATTPANYQIRVIGPDGQTTFVGNKTLSCESVGGGPSPTTTITLSPPVHPPSSTPASSPSQSPTPSHTRTGQSSSAAPSKSPVAHSSSARPSQPSSSFVNSGPGDQPVLGAAAATSQAVAVRPSTTPTTQVPLVSASPSKVIVAEPPLVKALRMGSPLSMSALLIVLVFAASMAGLVGSTIRSARRR